MLVEGTVIGVEGDYAIVSVKRTGSCGRCSDVEGCGSRSVCESYSLQNHTFASIGETVQIDLPDGGALKAATLAYLLPLLGMLFGAAIGKMLQLPDFGEFAACMFGGMVCAVLSSVAAKRGWVAVAVPRIVRGVQE